MKKNSKKSNTKFCRIQSINTVFPNLAMVNESWNNDPKRTVFTLSRYKFVSKVFEDLDSVLEIGCADAFGTGLCNSQLIKLQQ